jgi:16S rRNA (guanine966-N2)-methyltransferase
LGETALGAVLKGGWLAPNAMVIWEDGMAATAPEGFVMADQRKYGDTVVTLLRAPE